MNESGNIKVKNSCYSKNGKLVQSLGEAFTQNPPSNSKLKVSFLPKVIRWLPIGRGDYWVLKIDDKYQTALVGTPSKKYMWVRSRSQNFEKKILREYLDYTKQIGYDVSDTILTRQN